MDRASSTELTIHIVPYGVRLDELADYSVGEVGNAFSTREYLNVNKVEDGYSVIFDTQTLIGLNPQYLINNIMKIFTANLPGENVNISLVYLYEMENDALDDKFDMTVAQAIMMLDIMFYRVLGQGASNFRYYRSQSVVDTAETYQDIMEGNDDDDDDDDDPEEGDREFGYGGSGDPFGLLTKALRGYESEDDDDEDDHRKRKPRYDGYYESSRVLKSAKNPKRAYHRHGVLVARNKNAIKKDEKIIKAFLKEFIPGSAGWKKDLRDDLLKRWIHVYAVTNKQLRRLEKQHHKAMEERYRPKINTEKTLAIARQVFNVPIDNWSNPNK